MCDTKQMPFSESLSCSYIKLMSFHKSSNTTLTEIIFLLYCQVQLCFTQRRVVKSLRIYLKLGTESIFVFCFVYKLGIVDHVFGALIIGNRYFIFQVFYSSRKRDKKLFNVENYLHTYLLIK
jgi:hypothetical protein